MLSKDLIYDTEGEKIGQNGYLFGFFAGKYSSTDSLFDQNEYVKLSIKEVVMTRDRAAGTITGLTSSDLNYEACGDKFNDILGNLRQNSFYRFLKP